MSELLPLPLSDSEDGDNEPPRGSPEGAAPVPLVEEIRSNEDLAPLQLDDDEEEGAAALGAGGGAPAGIEAHAMDGG